MVCKPCGFGYLPNSEIGRSPPNMMDLRGLAVKSGIPLLLRLICKLPSAALLVGGKFRNQGQFGNVTSQVAHCLPLEK